MPRATYLATPLQILQSPGNFAIVYQENHAFRVFHPDTRPHFDATDWWMGDTRYRWEGDTLVADVAAITDQAWLDQAGNFHSTEFHVVERYRMTGPDVIEYEARIDDPVVYYAPLDAAHGPVPCEAARRQNCRRRVPGGRRRGAASYFAFGSAQPAESRLFQVEAGRAAIGRRPR